MLTVGNGWMSLSGQYTHCSIYKIKVNTGSAVTLHTEQKCAIMCAAVNLLAGLLWEERGGTASGLNGTEKPVRKTGRECKDDPFSV